MEVSNSSQRYRAPGLVLGLGALSIALLFVSDSIRERIFSREAEAALQVSEVETRLATLHLWVEEYVSGDTVNLDEIRDHQVRSRAILDQLAVGTEKGAPEAFLDSPEATTILARLRPQVDRFVDLSSQRIDGYGAGEAVGIGSPVDVKYDQVYYNLLKDLRALDSEVATHLRSSHERSRILFRFLLFAWAAILGTAAAIVWRHEKRRRTAEIALRASEAALLQSQKMEAIGSLAGGLSHDINNYLAAISAQCEVVRMRFADSEPVATKMDLVIETCSRASSLLQRLLAFSRGEAVQPEVVDLNRIIEGLEEMVRRLLGENTELDFDPAPGLWHADVAVGQVEQVIVNLVVNARDAMPHGGALRIETRNVAAGDNPLEPPSDAVVISISDTGTGISEEDRERIFEPFFTTKGKSNHSGLGLATVYGIMRQAGGLVRISPLASSGTSFDLYFPRSWGAVADPHFPRSSRSVTARRPEAAAGAVPSSGQRILLVEDNHELRQSTEELLIEMGFQVISAADGIAALTALDAQEKPFDLLMTDVVMPGINGNDLAAKILEREPATRVLFSSGCTDNVVLRAGVHEHAVNFLPKPYSAPQLSRAIQRVLQTD